MFHKVLVANRGEIAIRALRAGYELGARTVAVFPHEARNSLHRLTADASAGGSRAGTAARGCACERAGITCGGPPGEVLELTGNEATAVAAAREAGVPVLGSSEPSGDLDTVLAAAQEIGFPLFVKAVA